MPSDTTTGRPVDAVDCSAFSLELAAFADPREGEGDEVVNASSQLERHLASCLRCQAELAQYRKLLRALSGLRTQTLTPDDDLLDDILAGVRPPATVHRLHRLNRNRRAAYIGGIAAAATGVTAGAYVIASKLASGKRLAS